MRPRPSRALPADVRRRAGDQAGAQLLVEAVLDALPLPTRQHAAAAPVRPAVAVG